MKAGRNCEWWTGQVMVGMPRKTRLTPLQRDVLRALEEAGEETLGTVIATVRPAYLKTFHREVQTLVRFGYVCLTGPHDNPNVTLTAAGQRALTA
jgi:hypothetical protein